MEVVYQKKFVKELSRVPLKIRESVVEIMKLLKAAQTLESSGVDYKIMEGQKKGEGYYRIRVGAWRIGIRYIHPDIAVITILTRGDIYKRFPPK